MGLLRVYSRLLTVYPLATKSLTSAVLFAVGDLTSQYIETRTQQVPFHVDGKRTQVMALFGGVFAGPNLHFWYSSVLARVYPKPGLTSTLKKLTLDQTLFSSYFLVCFFFGITLLHGGSVLEAKEQVRHEFLGAMQTNWMIWPAVQIVNFGFVPVKFQVLVVNTVAIFWNAYLSYRQFATKV